jgi:hypothetical protein
MDGTEEIGLSRKDVRPSPIGGTVASPSPTTGTPDPQRDRRVADADGQSAQCLPDAVDLDHSPIGDAPAGWSLQAVTCSRFGVLGVGGICHRRRERRQRFLGQYVQVPLERYRRRPAPAPSRHEQFAGGASSGEWRDVGSAQLQQHLRYPR